MLIKWCQTTQQLEQKETRINLWADILEKLIERYEKFSRKDREWFRIRKTLNVRCGELC